jgi:hypothetical protein
MAQISFEKLIGSQLRKLRLLQNLKLHWHFRKRRWIYCFISECQFKEHFSLVRIWRVYDGVQVKSSIHSLPRLWEQLNGQPRTLAVVTPWNIRQYPQEPGWNPIASLEPLGKRKTARHYQEWTATRFALCPARNLVTLLSYTARWFCFCANRNVWKCVGEKMLRHIPESPTSVNWHPKALSLWLLLIFQRPTVLFSGKWRQCPSSMHSGVLMCLF